MDIMFSTNCRRLVVAKLLSGSEKVRDQKR